VAEKSPPTLDGNYLGKSAPDCLKAFRVERARGARWKCFFNDNAYKEICREARGLRIVDELRTGLRYAVRSLRVGSTSP
jgi:hypothetical protein